MEFFTHLLIGVIIGSLVSYFFPMRKRSLIFIGIICSVLPDIDIFLSGLYSIEERAEWYLKDDIPREIIQILNDGLGFPIEHRGITHSIELHLFLGIIGGILVILLSHEKNKKSNLACVGVGTINLIIHGFLDWGFCQSWDLTKTYWWEYPRTYGKIYSLPIDFVHELNELSFFILFLIFMGYYSYYFIIPNRVRFVT